MDSVLNPHIEEQEELDKVEDYYKAQKRKQQTDTD